MSLMTISEASKWATDYLEKEISPTNISYLIQYGKIKRHGGNSSILVDTSDLKIYYKSWKGKREVDWKKRLGKDLNWALSFDYLREKDTTKHVHRLHPYKGKFIPQLVQYFIDDHIDKFKKDVYFRPGDIILDPFSGSGTTLVQSSEMGLHSIGIDISHFNCMISEVKLNKYNFDSLKKDIEHIKKAITNYEADNNITKFDTELLQEIYRFNSKYFPGHSFRRQIQLGKVNESKLAKEKEKVFLKTYNKLIKKYNIKLKQDKTDIFLDKWYCENIRKEIDFAFKLIKEIKNIQNKKALAVILSRTIRSCRATTHSDLATLKEPQLTTYYCWKHKKICKPLYSIKYWFERYSSDTLSRLKEFDRLQSDVFFTVLPADSRNVNLFSEIKNKNKKLYNLMQNKKIRGIFTSPPYVGQIDYHEQHAYAYDLFGFKRKDESEIGPLYKGQGFSARKSYVEGIARVLNNCKKYLDNNYDIFLVANDKYNLYPEIAQKAKMKIVQRFKRPVLNRTERDRKPYSEIIFHLKSK